MRASRDPLEFDDLMPIEPAYVEALRASKVSLKDIFQPTPIRMARGVIAADGRFDPDDEGGDEFLAFDEPDGDLVFWHVESGALGTYDGGFALGCAGLANPGACALNGHLNIFANPITWLRFHRDGIVVVNWSRAYHNLVGIPRIAVSAVLLPVYLDAMQPPQPPKLSVLPMSEPTTAMHEEEQIS